ncbi:uncharacterized protein H6S33_011699 [Morchella sextelata]|uniref:uncharacterized protein n=1 Tax=Morchella sextelata TaxID=1174677 RepID=UPI001D03C986|nr:uncharacterized protein H6S33_011699 [Morchella sextelata]KAH0610172.1 hypothetical protein H6S33_011699 [Morchella sextelata]
MVSNKKSVNLFQQRQKQARITKQMLPLCLDDSDDSLPQSPKKHQLKIEVPTGKKARRKINNSTSTLIGNNKVPNPVLTTSSIPVFLQNSEDLKYEIPNPKYDISPTNTAIVSHGISIPFSANLVADIQGDPKDISESTPTIHIPVSRQSDSCYTFSQTDCNTISDEDEEEYEEQDKEGDFNDISESTPTIHIPVSIQSDSSYIFSETEDEEEEEEEEYEEQFGVGTVNEISELEKQRESTVERVVEFLVQQLHSFQGCGQEIHSQQDIKKQFFVVSQKQQALLHPKSHLHWNHQQFKIENCKSILCLTLTVYWHYLNL